FRGRADPVAGVLLGREDELIAAFRVYFQLALREGADLRTLGVEPDLAGIHRKLNERRIAPLAAQNVSAPAVDHRLVVARVRGFSLPERRRSDELIDFGIARVGVLERGLEPHAHHARELAQALGLRELIPRRAGTREHGARRFQLLTEVFPGLDAGRRLLAHSSATLK